MDTQQTSEVLSKALFPFQMRDVRWYEVVAQIQDVEEQKEHGSPLKITLLQDEAPPSAEEFGLLLRLGLSAPFGEGREYNIQVAIEGRFELIDDAGPVDAETVEQFKTRDAIILLWPYVREAVQHLNSRLRLDLPTLPVFDARAVVQADQEKAPHRQ